MPILADPVLYQRELIPEGISFILALVIAYYAFKSSRTDKKKTPLFLAFFYYAIYLVFHMYNRAIDAGLLALPHSEFVTLWDHFFKFLFFMVYGYAVLTALITDKLILRIIKTNVYAAILLILAFSVGSIIVEGTSLQFTDTNKELFFELVDMMIQILIVNIVFHSWRDTRSRELFIIATAFTLFFIANTIHIYNLIWYFTTFSFIVFHWIRVGALVLLLYTAIYPAILQSR